MTKDNFEPILQIAADFYVEVVDAMEFPPGLDISNCDIISDIIPHICKYYEFEIPLITACPFNTDDKGELVRGTTYDSIALASFSIIKVKDNEVSGEIVCNNQMIDGKYVFNKETIQLAILKEAISIAIYIKIKSNKSQILNFKNTHFFEYPTTSKWNHILKLFNEIILHRGFSIEDMNNPNISIEARVDHIAEILAMIFIVPLHLIKDDLDRFRNEPLTFDPEQWIRETGLTRTIRRRHAQVLMTSKYIDNLIRYIDDHYNFKWFMLD